MSATPEPGLRIVSFGHPESGVWGTALDAGQTAAVFGTTAATTTAATTSAATTRAATTSASGHQAVRLSIADENWELSGDAFVLQFRPTGQSAEGADRAAAADELCRVSGKVLLDGAERDVDCAGMRSYDRAVDLRRVESLRGFWGWFEGERAVALVALRPRGAAGQDGDQLAATVFDADGATTVDEPRLSTTYSADGLPSRASVELWIGEGDEQYPRRAAAEAVGTGQGVNVDGLSLQAAPLRCHSQGLDGPGVYLLARF